MNFKKQIAQIMRFLIGGGVGVLLYYAAFLALMAIGVWYITASFVGFIINVITNFFIQKHWTFKNKDKEKTKKQFRNYLFLHIGLLIGNTIILYVGVEYIGFSEIEAAIIATAILAVISFITTRIIFKNPEK